MQHEPNRGHLLNKGCNTSHAQNVCDHSLCATNMCDRNQWQTKLHVHNACSNHLFKMVSINIGSKESIFSNKVAIVSSSVLLWTQQHTDDFKKFLLVAEKWEEVLATDEWLLKLGLVFWMTVWCPLCL